MNFQQLRYITEVVRNQLSISAAAQVLHTSQPGISQQIRQLEEELGLPIFVRSGKRLTGITQPGQSVLECARRTLKELASMRNIGLEYRDERKGRLSIATTHTQARYTLPDIVRTFRDEYPQVRIELHQGYPEQIAQWLLARECDIAIATEGLRSYSEQLAVLPAYQWNYSLIADCSHPSVCSESLTLEEVAKYPIITYDRAFAGRKQLDETFARRGLSPDIVLTAIDSDIITTYVRLGLGVGLISELACNSPTGDHEKGAGLVSRSVAHLFPDNVSYIAIQKEDWVRGYIYRFIELLSHRLGRPMVEAALLERGVDDFL